MIYLRFLAFFLFITGISSGQQLIFAFLGIVSEEHPDIKTSLSRQIFEKLEGQSNLDIVSEEEIIKLQTQQILSKKLPNDKKAKEISNIMGDMLISSIYLNKIVPRVSKSIWRPFSATFTYKGHAELTILETNKHTLLFSGVIVDSISVIKWFPGPINNNRAFIDAMDKDKAIRLLMSNLAAKITRRIGQVTSGFSFDTYNTTFP